jgi:diguanylate cyclase (GGDEF)-like protein
MQEHVGLLSTIRVLLVDDDPDFIRMLRFSLQSEDSITFEAESVGTLDAAFKVLENQTFQVVLLDLALPDSQGIRTFEALAKVHPEVAYVILSGTDDANLALEAVQKGAQDYVVKGEIGEKMISRMIVHALERHRQKRHMEELTVRLEKLSILDPLTRLLNRRGLQRMLSRELGISGREGTNLSVIVLDLDNFKSINDTFGHAAGDNVLQEVAKIMRDAVRASDYVSRIGGDEFIILLPNTRLAEGIHFSERIREMISRASVAVTNGRTVRITASLGVTSVNRRMTTVDSLLEETHAALAKSKRLGKNRVSSGDAVEPTAHNVREMLRSGNCFRSVKQPIWDLVTGKVDGYEFFSRTNIAGFEMPDEFFNFSKDSNILSLVDERCLEVSLAAASEAPLGTEKHVNLFPSTMAELQAGQFTDLFPRVSLGGALCVEISEQQIMGDPAHLAPVIRRLKKHKILVAIKGVGFGRSSLESLIVLQPNEIKIDKKLVQNISRDLRRRETLRRLLAALESFHVKVIAEGIENQDDLDTLKSMGVRYGQGYFWGQPS